jgi:hypothetical protein
MVASGDRDEHLFQRWRHGVQAFDAQARRPRARGDVPGQRPGFWAEDAPAIDQDLDFHVRTRQQVGRRGAGTVELHHHRSPRVDPAPQRGRCVDRGQPSAIDDRHAVAQLARLVHVVRGAEHRHAAPAIHARDHVADQPRAGHVETGSRLVEEQDLRRAHQGRAQHRSLAQALGQLAALLGHTLLQLEGVQQLSAPPLTLCLRHAVQFGHQQHVLAHREVGVDVGLLRHDADVAARGRG